MSDIIKGQDTIDETSEVIESGEETTQEGQENANDGEQKETLLEEKPKNEVPLAKYLEEKNKRREIEKRLKELEANEIKDKYLKKWMDKGFEADYAQEQANIEYKQHVLQDKLTSIEMDSEIAELANGDDFFNDAVQYKTELKRKMKEKGLTAEEAYLVLRGKERRRELTENAEQKELINKRNNTSASKSNPTSSSTKNKNPYPLDDTDRKALQELQRMQPGASWTAEKYFKMVKQQ